MAAFGTPAVKARQSQVALLVFLGLFTAGVLFRIQLQRFGTFSQKQLTCPPCKPEPTVKHEPCPTKGSSQVYSVNGLNDNDDKVQKAKEKHSSEEVAHPVNGKGPLKVPNKEGEPLYVLKGERVGKCAKGCYFQGTCFEELGRCDCPASFTGEDCSELAMPQCQLTPEYATTCAQPSTCACSLDCEKWAFAHSMPCFDADDIRPQTDNLSAIYSRPQMLMNSDGRGKDSGRYPLPKDHWIKPHSVRDLALCPDFCSHSGHCWDGGCHCPLFRQGKSCESSIPRWDAPFSKCFNRCSQRGRCMNGFCHCRPGAFGMDCSLSLGSDDISDVYITPQTKNLRPSASGLRPRIYVYELPPWLNVWLFTHATVTLDRHEPYQFLERILHSPHRTTVPEEADYFFVPAWPRWRIMRGGYTTRVVEYISATWPFWNRTHGADHIFAVTDDWGPCDEGGRRMPPLANVVLLNLWGFRGSLENWAQPDVNAPPDKSCFVAGRDIAIPPNVDWNINKHDRVAKYSPVIDPSLEPKNRNLQFYFSGSSGKSKDLTGWGRKEYSFGIRQSLYEHFFDRQKELNWQITEPPDPHPKYLEIMRDSVFCYAPPGHGWGTRNVQAVIMGCIPVVVADNITQPWEDDLLDWTAFGLRVPNKEIPRLPDILGNVTAEEIAKKRAKLKEVWPLMLWFSHSQHPIEDDLKPEVKERLQEVEQNEDAFNTILLILRRRLGKAGKL